MILMGVSGVRDSIKIAPPSNWVNVERHCQDRMLRILPPTWVISLIPGPPRRFAQLENKVDSLFKELEVKGQTHLSETSRAGQNPSQEPSPASSSGEHGRTPDMPHSLGSYANTVPSSLHMWPLQAKEDDLIQLFFLYRDRISQHFPFVVIPDVPPAQIYAERPFLFKAIIMVASYKTRRYQYQLGTQLTEEVGKRLLVDGERSLDVLQGLLIHVAWCAAFFESYVVP